ncbi:MAG TPA: hypothetical protein VGJ27_01430 [Gaiellaceae bacterium]
MRSRRAAALAVLALLAAGCGSHRSEGHARPATGPPGVVRIAVADLLWPLDPARAEGRDEIAVARALFSTPLRTDPETGELRPGLCTDWSASADGRRWRFHCRHARAIAAELRRIHLAAERVEASDVQRLVISLREPDPELPYVLTEIAAAPQGVPGPFRVVSAGPQRIVAERPGLRLDIRKIEPHAALRLHRRGRLDEAPVPLGDLRALQRDPRLSGEVRVRRVLAVDLVVFDPHGSLARRPDLRRVYDETADRADYQALVPEFAAPPAENLTERGEPNARAAVLAARRARRRIRTLPRVAVRFATPADPDLAYGAGLLVASWRDLGLGAFLGRGRPDARFERVFAPYPKLSALQAEVRGEEIVPIAWVADARLVSPRLRGWSEDELGAVDYSRVRTR